jgi:hypothetical protein
VSASPADSFVEDRERSREIRRFNKRQAQSEIGRATPR